VISPGTPGTGPADVEIHSEFRGLKLVQASNAAHSFPPTMLPPTSIPKPPQQLGYGDMLDPNDPLGVSGDSILTKPPAVSEASGYHAGLSNEIPQALHPNACIQVSVP
jgi:hypothetical protein